MTSVPNGRKCPWTKTLSRADELKIIVEDEESIEKWVKKLEGHSAQHVWLHPEWSKVQNQSILESISNWVKAHGSPYRAGYQLHKAYDVDQLDPGTRPLVPLGGVQS